MAHRLPLADIQFIADFAAYARSRGDAGYEYASNRNCACAQFLRDTGRCENPSIGGDYWRDASLPAEISFATASKLHGGVAAALRGQDFSTLADRLEALIADAPVVSAAQ